MSDLRKNSFLSRVVAVLALLLLASHFAVAQTTTGNVQGVITDPNGGVVAGATVTVTNFDTGTERTATTNDDGFYRVTNLLPGRRYQITVNATGFAPATSQDVAIILGTESTLDIALNLTGTAAEVEVTGDNPLIQTTQSQLSNVFDQQQLTQLPLASGSIDNLALLTPGVIPPEDAAFSNGVNISANGNRGRSNNFQLDGQDNNDNSVAGPSLSINNAEAIGEYQIITNSFSAEFGRNSGAQINVITRPGTNDINGTLFYFQQASNLNARNNTDKRNQGTFQFLNRSGLSQFADLAEDDRASPYTYGRFGGAIGGPIVFPRFGEGGPAFFNGRDRAFFFVTYQGERQNGRFTTSNLGTNNVTFSGPSATRFNQVFNNAATAAATSTAVAGGPAFAQGVGNFILAPAVIDTSGDGIPDTLANPTTPGFLTPSAAYRNADGTITTVFTGEAVRVVPNNFQTDQLITREDFNITDRDLLTVRYIHDNSRFPLATGRFLAGATFDVPSQNNNLGVTYTRTINPNLTNEARFNFSRLNVRFGDPNGTLSGPGISFAGTRDRAGSLGLAFGTANNLPQSRKVDVFQYQDVVRATVGNNALSFGADIRQQRVNNFFLPNFLGTFTFTGGAAGGVLPANTNFVDPFTGASLAGRNATAFENFILGRPRDIAFAFGNPNIRTTQNDFFFFVQDDYKIRPNLTLNLGLRYEVSTQPFNPIIEDVNAREANASTALFPTTFPLADRTFATLPIDKNNFGPRVGFAYSPNFGSDGGRFRDGKTVIRGGFGVAYDPPFFNIVLNTVTAAPFAAVGFIRQTPGAAGSVTFPSLPTSSASLASVPLTGGGNPRLFNQTRVSPDLYNPYTLSYNFGIQQELFRNSVLEVRYVGSRIVGQYQTVNGNPDLRFLNAAGTFVNGNAGFFTGGRLAGVNVGTNGNGRIDPTLGITRTRINGASSTYNGLQTRFDTRLTNDITVQANYTFSRTIDNASEIFTTLGGGQTVAQSQNPFDITNGERGLSAFHRKHNFSSSFILDVPFFRDQEGFLGKVLGGFQFNGIVRLASGQPYTPTNAFATYDPGFENAFSGAGALRPFNGNPGAPDGTIAFGVTSFCGYLFGGDICNASNAVPGNFILVNTLQPGSTGTVVTPAQALQQSRLLYNDFGIFSQFGESLANLESFNLFRTPYGDIGRNTFFGQSLQRFDLSLYKNIRINEGQNLQFRVETQNVFNRRNFGVPDPITEDAFTGFTVGTFQNPGFNAGDFRLIQFGVRYSF